MRPSDSLKRAFLVSSSPVPLAVTRIVFFSLAFTLSTTRLPAEMAELPDELMNRPTGIGWLYALLPPHGTTARIGGLLMVVTALAAAVGIRARLAAAVWCVVGVWVWGIPNLFGKVDHNHHMLWFAALLAASPCADVLAFGARRDSGLVRPGVRYGFPIRIWWALIAVVYLFAGVPKIANDGVAWASPDNLRPLLHMQWAVVDGFEPLFRLDRYPMILWVMGLGTLLFELGFVALVFTRLRAAAVAAGIVFHLSTFAVLDISFSSLVVSYVAFLPWQDPALGSSTDAPPPTGRSSPGPDLVTVAVASVLLGGAVVFGAANVVDGWPFASYPAFAGRFPEARTELEFELVLDDGSVQRSTIDEIFAWVPPSRRARIAGQLLDLSPSDQRSVLSEIEFETRGGALADRVRAIRVVVATDPDAPVVLDREVVLDMPLDHSRS